jgi:exodeoxyribonuclease-3
MGMLVFCRSVYHLATPALAAKSKRTSIYKDEKFSDHAPLIVDYELGL